MHGAREGRGEMERGGGGEAETEVLPEARPPPARPAPLPLEDPFEDPLLLPNEPRPDGGRSGEDVGEAQCEADVEGGGAGRRSLRRPSLPSSPGEMLEVEGLT